MLLSRDKNFSNEILDGFAGMTRDPIEVGTLAGARIDMRRELLRRLTDNHKAFLIGLSRAQPDWELLSDPSVSDLPALRWKPSNLAIFGRRRPRDLELHAIAIEEGFAR